MGEVNDDVRAHVRSNIEEQSTLPTNMSFDETKEIMQKVETLQRSAHIASTSRFTAMASYEKSLRELNTCKSIAASKQCFLNYVKQQYGRKAGQLQEVLSQYEFAKAEFETDKAKHMAEIDAILSENSLLKSSLGILNTKIGQQVNDVTYLKAQLNEKSKEILNMNEVVAFLKTEVDGVFSEVRNLEETLDEMKKEASSNMQWKNHLFENIGVKVDWEDHTRPVEQQLKDAYEGQLLKIDSDADKIRQEIEDINAKYVKLKENSLSRHNQLIRAKKQKTTKFDEERIASSKKKKDSHDETINKRKLRKKNLKLRRSRRGVLPANTTDAFLEDDQFQFD